MDVTVKLLMLLSSLLLIQCNSKQEAAPSSKFVKSGSLGCDEQAISGEYLVVWKNGQVSVEHFSSDKEFVENFLAENADQILTSEPHYRLFLNSPNELIPYGWGGGVNWGVEAVEAPSVWDKKGAGEEIIVAVIDSGVDTTHDELQGVFAVNEAEELNGLDDDGNGLVDDVIGYDFVEQSGEVKDYTGHGTHVSGVIAARHDVGKVLGVAPDVKILPLGFIDSHGGGGVSGAIRAIRYAVDRGAKVINASWGGPGCSLPLRDEIAGLSQHNILFVAAAGNAGNDLSVFPEFPAAFGLDNIITVGASTVDNKTAGFSNYGREVDLVAPGANIVSTFPKEKDLDGNQDGLVALEGTSMAAPFVAAAAALLWSHNPAASYLQVKQALLAGVDSGPYPVKERGKLNIRRALEALE